MIGIVIDFLQFRQLETIRLGRVNVLVFHLYVHLWKSIIATLRNMQKH